MPGDVAVEVQGSIREALTVTQPVQVTVPGAVAVEVQGSGFVQDDVPVTQPVQVTMPGALKMKDVFLKRI